MVENKGMLWKIGAAVVAGVVVGAAGVGLATPNAEDIAAKIQVQIPEYPEITVPSADEVASAVVAALPSAEELPVDINAKLDKIQEKLVEEDVFKVASEELAKDELDDRSFLKDLAAKLDNIKRSDYRDIDDVDIKDIKVTNIDVNDGDARVVMELKVRYWSDFLQKNLRETLDVRFRIRENEVDDIKFI